MKIKDKTIGFAITGSFCTINTILPKISDIISQGAKVIPIFSEITLSTDTRFTKAQQLKREVEAICGQKVVETINDAEPIGPNNLLDAIVIAPCTGNTVAKIANGITDSCVTMAAKANLRNNNPVLIAISTNDGLSASAKNIGVLLNVKNIFFVPFKQDDAEKKPTSLVADMGLILPSLEFALEKKQIQPVLI